MKVRTSVKKMCEDCVVVTKDRKVFIKCKSHPRHNQKQKFYTYFAKRQYSMLFNRPYILMQFQTIPQEFSAPVDLTSSVFDDCILDDKSIV